MHSVNNLSTAFTTMMKKTWSSGINDVSLQVQAGSVLGIVGESGSGKSVTSFSIMRLHDENSTKITGNISFDKLAILNLSINEMR